MSTYSKNTLVKYLLAVIVLGSVSTLSSRSAEPDCLPLLKDGPYDTVITRDSETITQNYINWLKRADWSDVAKKRSAGVNVIIPGADLPVGGRWDNAYWQKTKVVREKLTASSFTDVQVKDVFSKTLNQGALSKYLECLDKKWKEFGLSHAVVNSNNTIVLTLKWHRTGDKPITFQKPVILNAAVAAGSQFPTNINMNPPAVVRLTRQSANDPVMIVANSGRFVRPLQIVVPATSAVIGTPTGYINELIRFGFKQDGKDRVYVIWSLRCSVPDATDATPFIAACFLKGNEIRHTMDIAYDPGKFRDSLTNSAPEEIRERLMQFFDGGVWSNLAQQHTADRFGFFWDSESTDAPPLTVEVRDMNGGTVGQVNYSPRENN